MRYDKKVYKLFAFSGWTQDKLADLMGVSTPAVNSWINGKKEPKGANAEMIDWLYAELVEPYVCELEAKADKIAAKLLKKQIGELKDDNVCELEEK